MSNTDLDAIHAGIGALLREVAALGRGQSELHVKVDSLGRTVKAIAADQMSTRFDVERAHRRIASLEHQVALVSQAPSVPDWRADPREITGTHDFAVIKAQHEEMRREKMLEEDRRFASITWWGRQRTLWIMAAAGALALLALGGCAQYVLTHLKLR